MAPSKLVVFINGKKYEEDTVDPRLTLLHYLRDKLLLRGTKEACGVGACGACTVMLSKYDRGWNKIRHWAVTACLVPLCAVHGCAVTTVEGVGSTRSKVHVVQERLALGHGTQCGFCSPGMVMSMYTLLRNQLQPSMAQIERALEGNLCRCTGYRPILQSFGSFAKDCPLGKDCCRNEIKNDKSEARHYQIYDSSQEPIFPSELQLKDILNKGAVFYQGDVTWHLPCSVDEVLTLMKANPDAILMAGNTALQERYLSVKKIICLTNVAELQYVSVSATGIDIGAGTTICQLEESVEHLKGEATDEQQRKTLDALLAVTTNFASGQLRNLVTIGGSVKSRVKWSDINPLLTVLGAVATVASSGGNGESIPVLDLLHNNIERTKLITRISVPFLSKNTVFWWHKTSRRQGFDTALVNMAARLDLQGDSFSAAKLVVGGIQEAPVVLIKTTNILTERGLDTCEEDLDTALASDLPADTAADHKRLVAGLVSSFIGHVKSVQMGNLDAEPQTERVFTNLFDFVSPDQEDTDAVGRPVAHLAAIEHTTGEAQYVSDMPEIQGQYHLSLVTSTRAHAQLVLVDAEEALATPGVVAFFTHRDFPGSNMLADDEPYFAIDKVVCIGQPIGAIVAIDRRTATIASYKVKVTYKDLEPILTIEDAIKKACFLPSSDSHFTKGDTETDMLQADHVVLGEVATGGQEHFYMEPQGALVVPRAEKGEMDVYCGTQAPYMMQQQIATALALPLNRITVCTKRIGGAFGGKESRSLLVAVPVALAAFRLQRPVRCVLYRKDDMVITGGRHPMTAKYKVGFDKEGRILACHNQAFVDAGHSGDSFVSAAVAGTVSKMAAGGYHFASHTSDAKCCKTNLPSNTSMRGFGRLQAICIGETVIDHVASFLGKPRHEVQRLNLLKEGDYMFGDQIMDADSNNLARCWKECSKLADFESRFGEIQEYNRKNQDKKRGIAMIPIRHDMGYWTPSFGQGTAVLQVYAEDGSIMLHIGGVEMGQGLYTKMIQVASRTLGICMSKVHINGTRTDVVPNACVTSASLNSELYGVAVKDACDKMMERIAPYKAANPGGGWENWVRAAYDHQESLAVTGLARMGHGDKVLYYTYGACCSEIELDCHTGAHRVIRTDIVMDLGKSLNPAVDIGQIEGGFMMGYGFYMMEEMHFDHTGKMSTAGADKYKIPSIRDTPGQINVHLLKNSENAKAIYSSKAVGEPPMVLAVSAFVALRQAVAAARTDRGRHGFFRLDAPATSERVLGVLEQ